MISTSIEEDKGILPKISYQTQTNSFPNYLQTTKNFHQSSRNPALQNEQTSYIASRRSQHPNPLEHIYVWQLAVKIYPRRQQENVGFLHHLVHKRPFGISISPAHGDMSKVHNHQVIENNYTHSFLFSELLVIVISRSNKDRLRFRTLLFSSGL